MKNILKLMVFLMILPFSIEAINKDESNSIAPVYGSSQDKLKKINAYRDECLQKHQLYGVLSNLIQQYDPIEDKWECEHILKGHKDYVGSICLLPRNRLASCSRDKTIKIWNLDSGKCEKTFEENRDSMSVCLLPGNKLASCSRDGLIGIWNLTSYEY